MNNKATSARQILLARVFAARRSSGSALTGSGAASTPATVRLFAPLIVLLMLADGVLHLALDFVLFRGNLFGPLGPLPAPSPLPLPLPLNQMFVLNLVGYLVLAALFLWVTQRSPSWRWLIDVVILVYVAVLFIGWILFGAPNPLGLGYLSKAIEIVLALALLTHRALPRASRQPAAISRARA